MVFTPFHTEGAEARALCAGMRHPPSPPRFLGKLCANSRRPWEPAQKGSAPSSLSMGVPTPSPPQGCRQSARHTLGWGLASPCRLERAGPCTPPSSLEPACLAAAGPQPAHDKHLINTDTGHFSELGRGLGGWGMDTTGCPANPSGHCLRRPNPRYTPPGGPLIHVD